MSGWITGAAIVVGAVGGALINKSATDKASDAQKQAMSEANRLQWDMYQQQREDVAPWRKAGAGALGQIEGLIGPSGEWSKGFTMADFTKDPGYQFRLEEGQKALERGAAARGSLMGGAGRKAIERYGQDYASNEYNNSFNRYWMDRTNRYNQLAGLAGIGQTANGQIGASGTALAGAMGQNYMNYGGGQSAAALAQGNAWSGALNQGLKGFMQMYKGGSSGTTNQNPWGGNLYGSGNGGTEVISEPAAVSPVGGW